MKAPLTLKKGTILPWIKISNRMRQDQRRCCDRNGCYWMKHNPVTKELIESGYECRCHLEEAFFFQVSRDREELIYRGIFLADDETIASLELSDAFPMISLKWDGSGMKLRAWAFTFLQLSK